MKKHDGVLLPALLGAMVLCSGSVAAQSSADKSFATEAASGGMLELALGRLARIKGSSPEVKQFGKEIEIDHSKAAAQLQDAASRSNIALPNAMNKSDQSICDRIEILSGAEFDRAYAEEMVEDINKNVAAFEKEIDSGADQNVKRFASEALPKVELHLMHAEAMRKALQAMTH